MSIKPILFNTDMVNAILEGRKTQTRRIIKPVSMGLQYENGMPARVPPYETGDVLWVRETWTVDGRNYYYRTDFESDWLDPCETLSGGYPVYCSHHPGCEGCMREKQRIHWRPSIHMPKEAARIFLRVTGIRAVRLQDMDEGDVCDEGAERIISACEHMDYGIMPPEPCFNVNPCKDCIINHSYPELFGKMVWDKTIKPADLLRFGWAANPWVWVIKFTKAEKPEGWPDA